MNIYLYNKKTLLISLLSLLLTCTLFAQQDNLKTADALFKLGDFEKSKEIYSKLLKEEPTNQLLMKKYIQCLYGIEDYDLAEKYLKRLTKNERDNLEYGFMYIDLLEKQNKKNEIEKKYQEYIDIYGGNIGKASELMNRFSVLKRTDLIKQLIVDSRKKLKQETLFGREMAAIYREEGRIADMVNEVMLYAEKKNELDLAKTVLQNYAEDEAVKKEFEKILYQRIQKNPEDVFYTDFLIWHLVQQRQFSKAFIQARAMDRRMNFGGTKVFDLGQIVVQNKDYITAASIFEYVLQNYGGTDIAYHSYKQLLYSREEQLKTQNTLSKQEAKKLVEDYQSLLSSNTQGFPTIDVMRNMAKLYAFNLDRRDTAMVILEKAMLVSNNDMTEIDKCKIDLGDIYILNNEPYEATLLYKQVEKSQKEELLGQEAKLRSAKLYYYNSQFELAKDLLDILKKATSREIANDALQLSVLIQDNTGLDTDTLETAMKEYASVDLLLFQNKKQEAVQKMSALIKQFAQHSIADELYLLRAKTYLSLNESQKAVEDFKYVVQNFKDEITADDALYFMAKIYDEKWGNTSEAMKYYEQLMTKYGGSIYVVEARKRFRNLRGDAIN